LIKGQHLVRFAQATNTCMHAPLTRPAMRLLPAALLLTLAAGWFYLQITDTGPDMAAYGRVLKAAEAYRQDLAAKGDPIPPSVTLEQLLEHGSIQPREIRGFDGMAVIVSLARPEGQPPGEMLMRVRMPNGDEIAVLANGSVQTVRSPQ
jgi:hypothetical protein